MRCGIALRNEMSPTTALQGKEEAMAGAPLTLHGPAPAFPATAWAAFADAVKDGHFPGT
ncbi:hypothetical protein Sliba_52490 [Streptomyces nigrescens]|uniref:DUF397 domain-containing protein n=1 Tax=Streptomyces nigrescens TaxID=1920 RepID=A0A640TRE6_STRNI|nr:hypothetical protein Sliba_52490 [Streptomyces libani subsp. libani]GGV95340.1 hypothetical protein GCM10010500_35420 [Streptomyces libani subsp. libani]